MASPAAQISDPVAPPDFAAAILAEYGDVVVNSPAWDRLNGRRAALIRKKYLGGGLDAAEEVELEVLQQRSLELVDEAFPWPEIDPVQIALLERLERTLKE